MTSCTNDLCRCTQVTSKMYSSHISNKTGILIKREDKQGECHENEMMEAHTEMMYLHAKECPGLLAIPETKRKARNRFLLIQ